MPTKPPNLLVIMADQMTSDSTDLIAKGEIIAPNLQRLAENSARFGDTYCAYPLCAPSRASLMTGRLPSSVGVYDNGAELPASVPTLAHYLRAEGYKTTLAGKMHFIGPDQLHGFESRLVPEIYPCDFSWSVPRWDTSSPIFPYESGGATGNADVSTVRDSGKAVWTLQMEHDEEVAHVARREVLNAKRPGDDRPWMLTVSFTSPHDPWVIPAKYWEMYDSDKIPMPTTGPISYEDLDEHSKAVYRVNGMDRHRLTEDDTRRARHGYFASVSYVDEKIGTVLESLESSGQLDDTLVVFTSDHGEMLGERGMWFKKTFFEPAVKVPLLFSFPGTIEPGRYSGPVSLVDVVPTILDLLNVAMTWRAALDGTSVAEAILSGDKSVSTDVFIEGHDNATVAPRFAVRKGGFKLVYGEGYPTMLFNLRDDPHELTDLAGEVEYDATVQSLIALLRKKIDPTGLAARITSNQNDRRLINQAMTTGKAPNWKEGSTVDASNRYLQSDDVFPQAERDRYVCHSLSS